MRHILFIIGIILLTGCTSKNKGPLPDKEENGIGFFSSSSDTIHTMKAAMGIYAYHPKRALQIIDSAVIVGNLSKLQAEQCKARIYSMTQMFAQVDSLLGGPKDIRLDSAQAICERLLNHKSVKADLQRQQDVLDVLAHTERMRNDTIRWMQRLRELVGVCRMIGPDAETDALRTEAEIGAALYAMGKEDEGLAKMDSVIQSLNVQCTKFNGLDALIIASKRKISMLGTHNRYAETIPLARRIIECLDDYEAHPDSFHDGSRREPKNNEKRADYIRFYRSQAQNFITAAYASLGEHENMITVFRQIEDGVREATIREHIARYNALQQQMEAERQKANAGRANLVAFGISILALLFLALAVIVFFKNRTIRHKNQILAQQITEALKYKKMYWDEKFIQQTVPATEQNALTDEQLFQHINEVVVREGLFLDPKFERQTIMDRFNLSKERVGTIFSKGSSFTKLTNYVQQLRLEYAAKLLVEQPDLSIVQVANQCGFSSNTYFSDRFRQRFDMTPSEFRKASSERPQPMS